MVGRLRQRLRELTGGPLGGGQRLFAPGEVRWALLSLLEQPAHGYELMTRLEARCGGAYKASAGSIYPTLQQLEDEGLVRAEQVGGKKVYARTDEGEREVAARSEELAGLWRRVSAWGEWGVLQHPDAAEILGPALRLAKVALKAVVKSHADPGVIAAIRGILDDASAQIERVQRKARR